MSTGIFFKEFNVIKVLECNAFKHWKDMKVGKKVCFKIYDAKQKGVDNYVEFDKDLIRVILGKSNNGPIIGMLPQEGSKVIRDILINGWNFVFSGTICKVDEKAPYDQRISVAVYIRKHNKNNRTK